MPKLRILHLCNWYPNVWKPHQGPFIKRHIDALAPFAENTVWHIDVRPGPLKFSGRSLHADRTCMARIPTQRWLLVEWASTALLWWTLALHYRRRRYDLVNLHIAYPLGLHTRALIRRLGLPVVITEHWSAYHFSFNGTSKGLDRIRKIFHHDIPLITVSRALLHDIEKFSGMTQRCALVVDNVADTSRYHWRSGTKPQEGRFLAIAGWRNPKRPDVLVRAIEALRRSNRPASLRLAGDGDMVPALKEWVKKSGMEDHIIFLGHLSPQALAEELRAAHALLHCSDYETYSVVCVEALCTGTPVLASEVGGIPGYLSADLGRLVSSNSVDEWTQAIDDTWEAFMSVDREHLCDKMRTKVAPEAVGTKYFAALETVLGHWKGNHHTLTKKP